MGLYRYDNLLTFVDKQGRCAQSDGSVLYFARLYDFLDGSYYIHYNISYSRLVRKVTDKYFYFDGPSGREVEIYDEYGIQWMPKPKWEDMPLFLWNLSDPESVKGNLVYIDDIVGLAGISTKLLTPHFRTPDAPKDIEEALKSYMIEQGYDRSYELNTDHG